MQLFAICSILLILTPQDIWAADILKRPGIISGGGRKTVHEGGTLTLNCIFTGNPQPAVTWKRNGIVIQRAVFIYFASYTISVASASDSGDYVCEGVNSKGTGSATFTVTVQPRTTTTTTLFTTNGETRSPDTTTKKSSTSQTTTTASGATVSPGTLSTKLIVSEPDYYEGNFKPVVYVERGRTLSLYCSVTSSGSNPTITWYKGTQIVQTGGNTYRRSYFNGNHVGAYMCTATNGAGSHDSSVEVRLGSPLAITRAPVTAFHRLGDAITRRVSLSRQNDYELNWYRVEGSSLIKMQEGNGVYFQSGKTRMDISPLEVEYIGAYTVQAHTQWEFASANFSINAYLVLTTQQPRDTTPYAADSIIELPCAYYGYPLPLASWYESNVEIDPSISNKFNLSSDNTLSIGPLGASDNGVVIKCRLQQDGLTREIQYTLSMGSPPEIEKRNCDVALCQGSNVRIVCEAESDSSLTYKWYKYPSTPITSSNKYRIYSNGKLEITNANSNDAGIYICQAINRYGTDNIGCRLRPTGEVTLESTEQSLLLTVGRPANIYCVVNGSLGATISWYKDDNQAIPGDGSISTRRSGRITLSILSFSSVSTTHDGEYTCSVSSCGGDVEQTHRLKVRQDIEITRTPDRVDFCSGSTVSFPCEATGFPTPVINWYFNDKRIVSGQNGFQIDSQNTLIIIDASSSKTAYYTCNASNPFSWRTYRFRALFQDTLPPSFRNSSTQTPVLNGDFCLSCLPTVSRLEYTYKWYFQNNFLSNSAKYDQTNEWQLCITNFASQDLGTYKCEVTNCVGTSTKYFQIYTYQNQNVAPSILTVRSQYTVTESSTVRLFCRATGSPTPAISWYREGSLITADSHFSLEELPNLRIDNIQRNIHNGRYECRAENIAGSDVLSINLVVYQPPKLTRIRSQTVDVGLTACFDCSLLEGYPAPSVEWTRNSVELTEQGRISINENSTLCITGVTGEDDGSYRCTARNSVGWAYVQATLRVRTCGKLRFAPVNRNHTEEEGESLTIECPIEPNAFECSFRVIWKEVTLGTNGALLNIGSTDPRLVNDKLILFLDMNSTGLYQCIAYNEYAMIAQTHSVRIVAPPWEIPFVKQQIYRVNSEVHLNCPIRGVPQPSYIWLLEGFQLVSGDNLIVRNDQITINNAATSNTGKYACRGSNQYGRREVRFDVTICGPITIQLTNDHEVEEKSETSFTCRLNGEIVADSIEFFVGTEQRDITQLPSNRFSYELVEQNRAELTIRTRVEDTGPISCRINTTCGTAVRTSLLSVQPQESEQLRVVANQITHPGIVFPNCHNQFMLTCPVAGKPRPKYVWYFNNVKIKFNSISHVVATRGRKVITVLDPDINDAGDYRCNASTNEGRISYTYKIRIQLPISLSTYQSQIVFVGQQLSLGCNSTLLANRKWSKDSERISSYNTDMSNNLVIANVQSSDGGFYFCCAKSGDNIYRFVHEVQVQS